MLRQYTQYQSPYPSELCAIGSLMFNGVVAVVWVYSISICDVVSGVIFVEEGLPHIHLHQNCIQGGSCS